MNLLGVLAVRVGVFCWSGSPSVAAAAGAAASPSAGSAKTVKSKEARGKVPVAGVAARKPSRARTSPASRTVGAKAKAGRPQAGKAARQAQAARAPARKVRAKSKAAGKTASKVARGTHADRGAAAALAGAGIGAGVAGGARAYPASLHQSAPETGGTPSIGEAIGLHRVPDPLALRSAVALVVDAGTGEVLYEKNSHAVLPIASITKVMMAMVVLDARQSLEEKITIDESDRDTERLSASKLPVGSTLTRSELLQLALMSSENRAASALARSYPGGLPAFVAAANRKAAEIGMRDSVFMDGTGLSSSNVSTARDLAVMVARASHYRLISEYSTASDLSVRTAHGARVFRTTNRMVGSSDWHLSLQKTGYINESGNCLVMRGKVDGRSVILVLLDSYGRYSRLGDAQRIRRWLDG
jgi:D-alanyl-D-alanine endopeptidase (penicillin-binding protein 7)